MMMEATDLGNGCHSPHRRRLDRAGHRCVLLKRQMGPRPMIVVDVFA